MPFKMKNGALSSLDVLICLIHGDVFLYTSCILDIYKIFSPLMFLTIILTLHIDPAR